MLLFQFQAHVSPNSSPRYLHADDWMPSSLAFVSISSVVTHLSQPVLLDCFAFLRHKNRLARLQLIKLILILFLNDFMFIASSVNVDSCKKKHPFFHKVFSFKTTKSYQARYAFLSQLLVKSCKYR